MLSLGCGFAVQLLFYVGFQEILRSLLFTPKLFCGLPISYLAASEQPFPKQAPLSFCAVRQLYQGALHTVKVTFCRVVLSVGKCV